MVAGVALSSWKTHHHITADCNFWDKYRKIWYWVAAFLSHFYFMWVYTLVCMKSGQLLGLNFLWVLWVECRSAALQQVPLPDAVPQDPYCCIWKEKHRMVFAYMFRNFPVKSWVWWCWLVIPTPRAAESRIQGQVSIPQWGLGIRTLVLN